LGKFKKDLLSPYQDTNIFEFLEDFNSIYLQDFVNVFENQQKEFTDLDKSLYLLELLSEYRKISISNSEIIDHYMKTVKSLLYTLNYSIFKHKKSMLLKELELSKIKQKSSKLSAKTDLLKKLSDSIDKNRVKLQYLEEDYLKQKNQFSQIKSLIESFNEKIKDLNKSKKDCFNQINRITREMESPDLKQKEDDIPISNSEKIKELQKQAREFQFDINKTKTDLSDTKIKFNEINPKYEKLDSDYQELLNIINDDEERLKNLQEELKDNLKENLDDSISKIDIDKLKLINNPEEITSELQAIDNEINTMLNTKEMLLDPSNPTNLSIFKEHLVGINDKLLKQKEKLVISKEEKDFFESLTHFRKVETIKNEIEELLNKFLIQINLNCKFQLVISENYSSFSLLLEFIRANKEKVNFDELTTPEKIFFVMSLFISIKVQLNSKYIIFSNIFLPNQYNKRGSIFRTIDRILPVFEKEENLKDFSLIFILSNLEMKKPINKLIVKKVGDE